MMAEFADCTCEYIIEMNNKQLICPKCHINYYAEQSTIRQKLLMTNICLCKLLPEDIIILISKFVVKCHFAKSDYIDYLLTNDLDMIKYYMNNTDRHQWFDWFTIWYKLDAEVFGHISAIIPIVVDEFFIENIIANNNMNLLQYVTNKYSIKASLNINIIYNLYTTEIQNYQLLVNRAKEYRGHYLYNLTNISIYKIDETIQYATDAGLLGNNSLELLNFYINTSCN